MAFLDNLDNLGKNIGRKFSDTYKSAAKKSGELIEDAKLKIGISSEQEKIEDIYSEMGRRVYEAHLKGEDVNDIYKTECERIDAITEIINGMKLKILQMKNIKTCPKCKAEIELTSCFCPKCGTKQEIPEPNTESDAKACCECDAEVNEDDDYCPGCGKKVK